MSRIPEAYHDLFEKRTFADLATLMPGGRPHVTPVWVDYDGEHLLVNTVRGRRKERNVSEDPRVGLSMLDPDDPYRYLSVRGEVAELTEEGAVEHIDRMAKRYMDVDEYPNHGEEQEPRVIMKIRPDHVMTGG